MQALIIGAGILGASAAYHLARKGVAVEIVDESHQGKATLAGAGIVCPWATKADEPEWYRMYEAGARYYDELVAGLRDRGETQLGYGKVGALVVAEEPAELDAAEQRILSRTRGEHTAGAVRRVTAAEAHDLFPPLRDDLDGIYIPGGARVDARLLAAAMVRAAVALGARFRSDHVTLEVVDGRVRCRDSNNQILTADEIVVTAGAWARQILRPLGLEHPVQPQKGQIVHLGLPGVDTSRWPVLLPMTSHYMLAFDDSRVVIGATRETNSGFDYRVTAGGQFEVLQAGLSIAPGLANATHVETRIGFRPAAGSIRPILGRVPGFDGLVIGNGLGASGLTVGPYAGMLLAQVALGETPALSMERYAPGAA
ncbi:NAD(P)/FAD-dependent oxidoreductase [Mangrovibrevibacter kandeliae]|uniref:NAD(P)/FAD-dependent oxidoreductase n=1 Tax=Mangrovibrevibacter kandeliae TaxID=2968473 RepID=UPI0021190F91|nr:FAD-dependent oxidoreductase [Aurantimonas sp. CSK15Z-1]MCQ8783897.1 FAD-binding oxidoreductase [Aurantimonas sp. CSK15Z-1]